MKLYDWYKANFQRREDWKFRASLVLGSFAVYQLLVFTVPAVWNPILLVVFTLFLLLGVDFLADRRLAHKAEREAAQKQRAEEFGDRLDKSFGLDQ